jgi:hypothetical protein
MAVDMRGIAENVCLVYVLEDMLKSKADETFAGTSLSEYLEECRRDRRQSRSGGEAYDIRFVERRKKIGVY